MKLLSKKLFALLLILILVLSITACGSDDNAGGQEPSDTLPASDDSSDEVSENDDSSGMSDSISFWYMGDSANQLQPLVDAFSEETGITVNVQAIPWNGLTEKLLAAIASRDDPDCMQTAVSRTAELVAANAIMDLTEEINTIDEFSMDKYFEVSYNSLKMGDSYYGVPWIADVYPLFYRTDLFEDAGYSEFPTTWEELFDACTKINENTGSGAFDVILATQNYNFLMHFPFQAGCDVISEDGVPQFDTKEMQVAMEYLMSYIDAGISSDVYDGMEPQVKLASGITALSSESSALIPQMDAIEELEGKWDIAVWPAGPGGESAVYAGSNLVITSWTEKKDASLKWFQYLSRTENLLAHYEAASALPTTIEAWDAIIGESTHNMQAFKDQLEVARPFPVHEDMQEIGIDFVGYVERIMVGKEDISTVLSEMNDHANEIINR